MAQCQTISNSVNWSQSMPHVSAFQLMTTSAHLCHLMSTHDDLCNVQCQAVQAMSTCPVDVTQHQQVSMLSYANHARYCQSVLPDVSMQVCAYFVKNMVTPKINLMSMKEQLKKLLTPNPAESEGKPIPVFGNDALLYSPMRFKYRGIEIVTGFKTWVMHAGNPGSISNTMYRLPKLDRSDP